MRVFDLSTVQTTHCISIDTTLEIAMGELLVLLVHCRFKLHFEE